MSTVAQTEDALSLEDAEEVRGRLANWIEDQCEMRPEFLASMERGQADLAAGRTREVRPSSAMAGAATQVFPRESSSRSATGAKSTASAAV